MTRRRPAESATRSLGAIVGSLLLLIGSIQSVAQTVEWSAQSRGGSGIGAFVEGGFRRSDLAQIGPDGEVYFAATYSNRNSDQAQVLKLSASGAVLWKLHPPLSEQTGREINALRLVSPGRLVTSMPILGQPSTTLIVGYDSDSGEVIWQRQLDGLPSSPAPTTSLSVSVAGDLIVGLTVPNINGGSRCQLTRLDSAAGQTLWTLELATTGFQCPGLKSVSVQGDRVAWAITDAFSVSSTVFGVNRLEDGTQVWATTLDEVSSFQADLRLLVDQNHNVIATVSRTGGGGPGRVLKIAASDGLVVWNQPFRGALDQPDRIQHAVVDGAGDVYVLGHSGETANGRDLAVSKFAGGGGSVLWRQRKVTPASGQTYPSTLALDGAGGVVAGTVIEALGNSFFDFQATKFSTLNGVEAWSTRWGIASPSTQLSLYTLGITSTDRVVMTGRAQKFSAPLNAGGSLAMATIEAASGNLLAARVVDVPQQDMDDSFACGNERSAGSHQAVDQQGSVVVSGCRWGGSGDRAMLAKWSAAGTPLWDVDFDLSPFTDMQATSLVLAQQGDVVAAFADSVTESSQAVVRVDGQSGALRWNWIPQDNQWLKVGGVALDAVDGVVVVGTRRPIGTAENIPTIAALAPHTGTLLWSTSIANGASPSFNVLAAKSDGFGSIYVLANVSSSSTQTTGRLFKLSAADGTLLWSIDHPTQQPPNDRNDPEVLQVLSDGGVLTSEAQDTPQGRACRVSRFSATGQLTWRQPSSPSVPEICGHAALRVQGDFFYATYAVAGSSPKCRTEKHSLATGDLVWTNSMPSFASFPTQCRSTDAPNGDLWIATAKWPATPGLPTVVLSMLSPSTGVVIAELDTQFESVSATGPLELERNGSRVNVMFNSPTPAGVRARVLSVNPDGIFLDGFTTANH